MNKRPQSTSRNTYQWQVSAVPANGTTSAAPLTVCCGNSTGLVTLTGDTNTRLTTLETLNPSRTTVVKFRWLDQTYKWKLTSEESNKSDSGLYLSLHQSGAKQTLASIVGPGSSRQQCWVGPRDPDVIAIRSQTDDQLWVQIVLVSAMVAAKTQRCLDKHSPARSPTARQWK